MIWLIKKKLNNKRPKWLTQGNVLMRASVKELAYLEILVNPNA